MKVPKKVLVFAIIIGLITVIGLNYYINNLSSTKRNQIIYSKVVFANNRIPQNIRVTADMVKIKTIPAEAVHPQAITSLDKVIGKTSCAEIIAGEQVLSNRIVIDPKKAALAYRIPQNMRAVTIPNNEIQGVAGYINIGDKIDILATYKDKDINPVSTTYTQLQNIEVIAVGNAKTSEEDKKKSLSASITLSVKPAQAEVLVYALANGSLHYTLRNPIDTEKTNLNFYNPTNFSTYKER